jgi:hypothetical protein
MLLSSGKRDEALSAYRDGLAVAKAMAQKEPGSVEWLSSQAMIDSNIGALLIEAGHRDEAVATYYDGLVVAKALAARDEDNVEWQTSLVVGLYNLAEIGEETASNYTQALQILHHLDDTGALPSDKKDLIAKIESKLHKAHESPAAPVRTRPAAHTPPSLTRRPAARNES